MTMNRSNRKRNSETWWTELDEIWEKVGEKGEVSRVWDGEQESWIAEQIESVMTEFVAMNSRGNRFLTVTRSLGLFLPIHFHSIFMKIIYKNSFVLNGKCKNEDEWKMGRWQRKERGGPRRMGEAGGVTGRSGPPWRASNAVTMQQQQQHEHEQCRYAVMNECTNQLRK